MRKITISTVSNSLSENFNLSFEKSKFPYPNISTREGQLISKKYLEEKRGYVFLSEMKRKDDNSRLFIIGFILSRNSSELLSKIASNIIKKNYGSDFLLLQTYNIKYMSGTKLICLKIIQDIDLEYVINIYRDLNQIFIEFSNKISQIADMLSSP